jgi:hypothetical protein
MNSAEKPHINANVSVSSVHRRSPVFRISKTFLSKFITVSRDSCLPLPDPIVDTNNIEPIICWRREASETPLIYCKQ